MFPSHDPQATTSLQPRIINSSALETWVGGEPCIKFDGVNDILALGSGLSALNSGNNYSVALCYSLESAPAGARQIVTTNSSGTSSNARFSINEGYDSPNFRSVIVRNTSTTNYVIDRGSAISLSTRYLGFSINDSSLNMSYFMNSSSIGTNTYTGSYVNDNLEVGGSTSFGAYGEYKIPELIIFGSDESANRTAIESDINTHYSIY